LTLSEITQLHFTSLGDIHYEKTLNTSNMAAVIAVLIPAFQFYERMLRIRLRSDDPLRV
jgi:hypothetical protein